MKTAPLRAVLAALLAVFAGVASAAPPPSPHPALWKLADADTTIYLFGTIHALPQNYRWQDDRLAAAIAASDRLVIEAVLDGDPAKASALLMRLGRSPGLPPLAARVKPGQRTKLAKLVADTKLPPNLLDGLETWAAALVLSTSAIMKLSVSTDQGVEERLKAQFAAARKPIEGLETAEVQLGFLDALPERDQRAFLAGVIEEKGDARVEFDRMLAAWARGDDQAIARTFDDEMKSTPGLDAALIGRRNAAWADALIARLAQPGTTLVAVGAGHLVGRNSVQAMLARKGYKVERLR